MANYVDDKSAEMLNDGCEVNEVENMKHVTDTDASHGDMQQTIIIDAKREKALIRKIDWRLLPILSLLYTMCFIDRSSMGAARISGIDDALNLAVGSRVSIALLVFYIGYVIVELPSNVIIRKAGPAAWLSFLAVSWGIVTLAVGFIKNWYSLVILRVLLGIFEGGVFPGCVYLVSSWYKSSEVQKRIAIFFLTGSFLSSFSNILAYGLIYISSDPFVHGWKWIFIVEGALTIAIGIGSYFVMVDFPTSKRNRFLTSEEAMLVEARAFQYQSGSTGVYAFLFFLPIILKNSMGFSQQLSFLLSTPPAAFSVIVAFTTSWFADRLKACAPFMFFAAVMGIVGLAMIGFIKNPIPRYIGAFLGQAASNTIVVTGIAWGQNNVREDQKRAVVTAVQITLSAIGGIYSSTVFRQQDAPNYLPGVIAMGLLFVLNAILAPITILTLRRANKRADQGLERIEGTDWFRYTI